MATRVQFRRGTTAEHASFTGAAGEMTIDTTLNIPVVHDGVTAGGHPVTGGTIADGSITNAKLANMASNTIKGNVTGGAAAPSDLTVAQVRGIITEGTTEVDAIADGDKFVIEDVSATAGVRTKHVLWSVIKTAIASLIRTVIEGFSEIDTIVDADGVVVNDASAASGAKTKTIPLSALKTAIGSGGGSSSPNIAINGNFIINQLAKSGTVTLAAGAYGHDMWKAGASGCTYTFATSENITTLTITAGSLIQVIEGLNLQSGTVCLSWAGTAQGKIGAGSYAASGVTGTATGGTNLNIEFNTGTLSKVRLDYGSTALAFVPSKFAEELTACQRYYEKSYALATAPASATSVGCMVFCLPSNTIPLYQYYGKVNFVTPKRAVPTVTVYPLTTPTNTSRVSNGSSTDLGAGSGAPTFESQGGFQVFNNSGGSLTTAGNIVLFQWAADARL